MNKQYIRFSPEIAAQRNNCALLAAAQVSDIDDQLIIKKAKEFGYNVCIGGMPTYALDDFYKSLGFDIEVSDFSFNLQLMTVNQALKKYNDGVYFFLIRGHIFVASFGEVIDPNCRNGNFKSKVFKVIKINNHNITQTTSPIEASRTLKLEDGVYFIAPWYKRAQRRSENYRKFNALDVYLRAHPSASVRDIFTHSCGYISVKFIKDAIKRGILKIESR